MKEFTQVSEGKFQGPRHFAVPYADQNAHPLT